ncbi:Vegetative incompatibility protein HET-E-1 [Psilocybe cubensis]|nr:Vegetative incompatibility protein HET-E-1 [Psilocybe cubensis]KAH9477080.1 Vegetative incompatibility protein HET-E-1 [Psilocybe cubensis]
MKLALSSVPPTDSTVKEFMASVEADVSALRIIDGDLLDTATFLKQTLNITVSIIGKLSKAHPLLNVSWTVIAELYEVVKRTHEEDESIQDLAKVLHELLATANELQDLPVIASTTNVIEDIARQSLRVAALIHDYASRTLAGRILRTPLGEMKSRIEKCQKDCTFLRQRLYGRVHIDNRRTLDVLKEHILADKIYKWLWPSERPIDISQNYNEAHGKRQSGTCLWFYEDERFSRWLERPGFIWVHGQAGSGKTILISSIIDRLPEPNLSTGVGYFLFDARDGQMDSQQHMKFIRSLLYQLSDARHGGIPQDVVNLYHKCGAAQPLDDQLEDLLRRILARFERVFVVIDALDECADRHRTRDWIKSVLKISGGRIHLVITSRPELDIKDVFEELCDYSVDVGTAENNTDIATYIDEQMRLSFTNLDKESRDAIASSLKNKAEGSFRYIALQLAELEACSSRDELEKALINLPEGLDEIYDRILRKCERKHVFELKTFLQFLAFSTRPMSVDELAETITIDFSSPNSPTFNPKKRYLDPNTVLKRCGGLVTILVRYSSTETCAPTVILSHFSVKEYLISNRIRDEFRTTRIQSHNHLTTVLTVYLLEMEAVEAASEHPTALAYYAARNWEEYIKFAVIKKSSVLFEMVLKLLRRRDGMLLKYFNTWSKTFELDPLYVAALHGLHPVVESLLEAGEDPNATCGTLGNALQAACIKIDRDMGGVISDDEDTIAQESDYEAVVSLILKNGADVNAAGGEYDTALQAACYAGNQRLVEMLLESGADVNAQGGESRYGNALQAAAYSGHDGIVALLLEHGANIHAEGGKYGNALQAACYKGHQYVVQMLLEHGADTNIQEGEFGNALQAAAYCGHQRIVTLLLEHGADINAVGGEYGNALQAACFRGNQCLVEMLLKHGAKTTVQGGEYGNAIQAAAFGCHDRIVTLLLEHGADINATGGQYGSTLQAACCRGSQRLVEILLENRADVNAQGGHFGNALQAAAQGGYNGIVTLLLEYGADINAAGGEYGNALQAACYQKSQPLVEMLLKNGADVNAQGGDFGNALQAAAYGGNNGTVCLLLEHGADVNAEGGKFGTALQAACEAGNQSVVEILLDKGADTVIQGGLYGNALQAAAYSGHQGIVILLLQNGADVNAAGGILTYGNALQTACFQGNECVVEVLLKNGADANAQEGSYDNALQAAAYNGHDRIVALLLEHGADIHAVAGKHGSALEAACSGGSQRSVEMIMDHILYVSRQGRDFGNALQAAAFGGHNRIVTLLLEHGADINAVGGEYGSVLQAACNRGNLGLVKMLLDRGAEINTEGGEFGNAIHAAALGGHDGVVTLLLKQGADVNAIGGQCGSALQAACCRGNLRLVEMLLEHGADVNVQCGKYGNALQAAACSGHNRIVALLLEHGANIHATGGQYGSALQAACCGGSQHLVEMLLKTGADTNTQGGHFGNPLQAAAYNGRNGIVACLLEHGANVNAKGGEYGSALQAACLRGHKYVVKMLLQNGADTVIQGGVYGNALQAAAYGAHDGIVILLLQNGAVINATGGKYGNALQAVCENKYHWSPTRREKVIEVLLEYGAEVTSLEYATNISNPVLQQKLLDGFEDYQRNSMAMFCPSGIACA